MIFPRTKLSTIFAVVLLSPVLLIGCQKIHSTTNLQTSQVQSSPAENDDFMKLKRSAEQGNAITHIASSYYRLANDEQAKIYYSQAIQLKPDTAQHYYNRGLCYQNLNETQLAIADFETVLKLDPNHEKAKAALAKLKPAKKSWFW